MKNTQRVTLNEIQSDKKNKAMQKSALKAFRSFYTKNIKTYFVICLATALIITLITMIPAVQAMNSSDEMSFTFTELLWSRIKMIVLVLVSGIVPYMFMPVIATATFMYVYIGEYAYMVSKSGYFFGILKVIFPLALDIVAVALIAAIAMYISKTATVNFKISKLNNLNWTTFKLKVYEATGNSAKYDKLMSKKDKKEAKLENSKTKRDWKNIFIGLGIVILLEILVVIIEKII